MSAVETKTIPDPSAKGRKNRATCQPTLEAVVAHVHYPLVYLTREQASLIESAILALAVDLEDPNPALQTCTYSDGNGYVVVRFSELQTSLIWLYKVLRRRLKLWEGCRLKVFTKEPLLKEATHIYSGSFPDSISKKAKILKSIGSQNALPSHNWIVLKVEKCSRSKAAVATFTTDAESAKKIDELSRKVLYGSGTVQLAEIDPEELRKGVWPKPGDKKKDPVGDSSKDRIKTGVNDSGNSKSNSSGNSNENGNCSGGGVSIGNRGEPNRLGNGNSFPNGGNSSYRGNFNVGGRRFRRNASFGGGKWPSYHPFSTPWVGGNYMYDRRPIYGPGPIPGGRNSNEFYIGRGHWSTNDRGDDQFWKD